MMPVTSLNLSPGRQGHPAPSLVGDRNAAFNDLLNVQAASFSDDAPANQPLAVVEAPNLGVSTIDPNVSLPGQLCRLPVPRDASLPAKAVPEAVEDVDASVPAKSVQLATPVPAGPPCIDNFNMAVSLAELAHGPFVGSASHTARPQTPSTKSSRERGQGSTPEADEPASVVSAPAVNIAQLIMMADLSPTPKSNSAPEKSAESPSVRIKSSSSPIALLTMSKIIAETQSVDGRTPVDHRGHNLTIDNALAAIPTSAENRQPAPVSIARQALPDLSHLSRATIQADPSALDSSHIDLLMRDISELTSSAAKASFQLSSEHLGRLQVRLEASDLGVSVAIKTDNEHGHVAVSHAQNQLKDELHTNGLKVSETSVALSQGGADRERPGHGGTHRFAAPQIEFALENRPREHSLQSDRPDGRFA